MVEVDVGDVGHLLCSALFIEAVQRYERTYFILVVDSRIACSLLLHEVPHLNSFEDLFTHCRFP